MVESGGFLSQIKMTQIMNASLETLENTGSGDYLIYVLINGVLYWYNSSIRRHIKNNLI